MQSGQCSAYVCLWHAGIVMFAVGVGKAVEEELRAIASEPVEQHFSYSADFTTMTHLVENFKLNICPEEGKGEMEIRSPCECEALVQFQTNTVAILQSLTEKNILWGDAWDAGVQGSLETDCTLGKEGWINGIGKNFRLLQGEEALCPPDHLAHSFLSMFTCSDDSQT
uniref:Matrilin coiled-coil trimerisation domain-containing protein n=1 Tax=Athene cunicularia TaxID=194338 RepID=A0A663N4X1_ATHCN